MDKERLIQITGNIYKKTILFPKKEPLRYKLRETADDILAGLISWEAVDSLEGSQKAREEEQIVFNLKINLDIINSYFEIAKWQNWISYFEILEIQEEYANILRNINRELVKAKEESKTALPIADKAPVVRKKEVLDERKQKILDMLKEKEKIQVWEANEAFPQISKRTIRRDFVELLNQGLIERKGESNNTFYQLKRI